MHLMLSFWAGLCPWCSHACWLCSHPHCVSSPHSSLIFSFCPCRPIVECRRVNRAAYEQDCVYHFKKFRVFPEDFSSTLRFCSSLLLVQKWYFPGNSCLLSCLMLVIIKVKLRMIFNLCTILYFYFNYIWHRGIGKRKRKKKVIKIMWICGRLSKVNIFWISSMLWNDLLEICHSAITHFCLIRSHNRDLFSNGGQNLGP